jgi:hypothetical protein
VHVFWIGTDGLIWTTQGTVSSGTELTWSLESSISTADSSARTDGVVAAVARTPNIVNIFWIGNDGDIWIKKWASGTWGAHVPVFRSRVADPAAGISAVALTSNEVHIFYISNINGFNGVIDTQFPIRRDGIFAILSFFPVTGRDASQPDALVASDSRSPQTRSVFWIDNDGGIWTRTWTSGRWNDQTQIAGRESTLQGTGVTVSDRSSLISDLFWKGTDGRSVFTSSFRNNVWSSPVKIS